MAGAAATSLVVALLRIQRFLFVVELALMAEHRFVAMAAPGEALLVEAASAGFTVSICLVLF